MEKFLMEMKKGVTTKSSGSDGIEELLIPLQKVPELGLKYARLYREVKIQEIVFELLTQQYEQAKIREMEDTPTLQILQKATPPFLKCRPKKLVIILISVIFAVMVSFVIVLTQEFLERMKNQRKGDYEKIAWIFDQIKQDLKALNFKK